MLNVVSLFHGMGCLNIAMNRAGIRTGFVYTSEIDKYATKVDIANNPDNIRMGDVRNWRDWGIDWSSVDLVTAGSPCQGFSSAGKQGGTKAIIDGVETVISTREQYTDAKQRGAEFLSQSHLFWEFVLLLDVVRVWNPNVKFMLENVKMSRNNLDMITEALGVEPVFINSALVSAQNRQRYYWCNWVVPQPEDRGIVLADILEDGVVDRDKSWCLDANYHKGTTLEQYLTKSRRQIVFEEHILSDAAMLRLERKKYSKPQVMPEKTGTLNTKNNSGQLSFDSGTTLVPVNETRYRKLTPIECERLQGVPDNYTAHVSNTQRYRMLGNGWQCDTIEHILRYMNGA